MLSTVISCRQSQHKGVKLANNDCQKTTNHFDRDKPFIIAPLKMIQEDPLNDISVRLQPNLPTEPNSDFRPRGLLLSLRNCLSENWSF